MTNSRRSAVVVLVVAALFAVVTFSATLGSGQGKPGAFEGTGAAPNQAGAEVRRQQPQAPPDAAVGVEDRVALLERKLEELENQLDRLRADMGKIYSLMMQRTHHGGPRTATIGLLPRGGSRYPEDPVHVVVEPAPEEAISRRYALPRGRSDALARFVQEQGLADIELRVDGDELEVVATPEVHAAVAPFIALLGKSSEADQ